LPEADAKAAPKLGLVLACLVLYLLILLLIIKAFGKKMLPQETKVTEPFTCTVYVEITVFLAKKKLMIHVARVISILTTIQFQLEWWVQSIFTGIKQ
jgi:hypothetical protein